MRDYNISGGWDWVSWGWAVGADGSIRKHKPDELAFRREAEQEMLRLILDVQQNRNRPEGGGNDGQ